MKRGKTPTLAQFRVGDHVVYCGPGKSRATRAEGLIDRIEGPFVRFNGFIAHRDFIKPAPKAGKGEK